MAKYLVTVAHKSSGGSVATRNYTVDAPDTSTAKEIALDKCRNDNPNDRDFSIRSIDER